MVKLTEKQRRFVEEYLIDGNASAAARRAGYSPRTAFRTGQENMQRPAVLAAIEQARQERTIRTQIDADEVMRRIDDQYRKADELDDINNALKATDQLGKLATVGAFKERVDVTVNDIADTLATRNKRLEDEQLKRSSTH